MCSLETYKIDLKGLMEDERVLDFDLNDDFFQSLDGSQLEYGTLHVSVSIRKMTGFFELHFLTKGFVTVSCDRCLDDMEQPIEADNVLTVKTRTKEYSTCRGSSMSLLCWPYPSSTFMHLENAIVR